MELKMSEYKNDMEKDVTMDLQMKPTDVLIIKRHTNKSEEKFGKPSYLGFTKGTC